MAWILDTDHLSVLQRRESPAFKTLSARLATLSEDDICTTVISFHEQMQGWLAFLNRARSSAQVIIAYDELDQMWRSFCEMNVLPYSDTAEDEFVVLRRQRIRVATLDLRIASIALATDSTVLTRNIRDFSRIPRLRVEDWTK